MGERMLRTKAAFVPLRLEERCRARQAERLRGKEGTIAERPEADSTGRADGTPRAEPAGVTGAGQGKPARDVFDLT